MNTYNDSVDELYKYDEPWIWPYREKPCPYGGFHTVSINELYKYNEPWIWPYREGKSCPYSGFHNGCTKETCPLYCKNDDWCCDRNDTFWRWYHERGQNILKTFWPNGTDTEKLQRSQPRSQPKHACVKTEKSRSRCRQKKMNTYNSIDDIDRFFAESPFEKTETLAKYMTEENLQFSDLFVYDPNSKKTYNQKKIVNAIKKYIDESPFDFSERFIDKLCGDLETPVSFGDEPLCEMFQYK